MAEPDNLQSLIDASEIETVNADAVENTLRDAPIPMTQRWVIAGVWMLCLIVALGYWQLPVASQHDLGARSVETRVNVAMYHAAHRVETYRQYHGQLPDYLDPAWLESREITYERMDNSYEIVGEAGEYRRSFRRGDDAEALLHPRLRSPVE